MRRVSGQRVPSAIEEFIIPLINEDVGQVADDPNLRRIIQRHRCRISFLPLLSETQQKHGRKGSRVTPVNFVMPRCRVRVVGDNVLAVRRCCRQLESSIPAFASRLSANMPGATAAASANNEMVDDGRLSLLCARKSSVVDWRQNLMLRWSGLRSLLQEPSSHVGQSIVEHSDNCSVYFTQTEPSSDKEHVGSVHSSSCMTASQQASSKASARTRRRRTDRKSIDSESYYTICNTTVSVSLDEDHGRCRLETTPDVSPQGAVGIRDVTGTGDKVGRQQDVCVQASLSLAPDSGNNNRMVQGAGSTQAFCPSKIRRGKVAHRRVYWFLRASAARLRGNNRQLIGAALVRLENAR